MVKGTEWMPGMKPVNPGPKCPVDFNEICDYEFECATECFHENGCLYAWGKRSGNKEFVCFVLYFVFFKSVVQENWLRYCVHQLH